MPHREIAEAIAVPKETVDGWFKTRGILSPYYKEFADEMNAKRKANLEKQLYLSDEEIYKVLRLTVQRFHESLLSGEYRPTLMDVVRVWKMQRVMRGLPTNIKGIVCRYCGHLRLFAE